LRYLKRFDVHTLKIDRSFVQDIPHDPEDNAIAIAVIALGHGMGLKVIAEGVETDAQAEFLRSHDCDEMQGYLLSQAVPPEQFARLYLEHRLNRPAVETPASPAALNAPELFEN
jgi:EAL domain-containing protein (putative c-di-GMP-specific phosphodiesterase class I)